MELHYRYGFSFSGKLISEEWLYRQKEDTNEIELFVRTGGKIQINEKEFPEGKGKEDTLNNNRLFLSLIAQLNGVQSKEIIFWFNRSTFATALKTKQYLTLTSNLFKEKGDTVEDEVDKYVQMALTFLSDIDTRIKDLSITEEPDEFPEYLRSIFNTASLKIESTHNRYNKDGDIVGKEVFSIEHNESEGTQKITELLGLIFITLSSGRLLVIDELDAKLHPLLTRAIIQLFTCPKINQHGAQLVFTTHDTNQLHLDYVRRDEIWFTEKSPVEATELYSHIEFKDFDPSMDITEQYVNGRYGAIPRIKVQR